MVYNIILPVFLIILVSFIFGKIKKINIGPVVDVGIYLSVPCLVFHSIATNEFLFNEFFTIFFAVSVVVLGSGLLAFFWFKLIKKDYKGFLLTLMFPNTANIGFPIVELALGDNGLAKAVIYSTFTSLYMFSLGVYIVAKKANFKEIFKLPLIYAVIFGIFISFFKIGIPEAIMKPIELLGEAAIPLQLIILGYSLSFVKLKSFKLAIQGTLFRFISGFIISLGFVSILGVSGIVKKVIILQSVMPSALFCIILSQKYKSDSPLIASTVFLSTILAMLFIPLVIIFLH